MRVSTQQVYLQSLSSMLDIQARAAKAQLQIASGKRILTPADDPTAAAGVLRLEARLAALKQYDRNAGIAELRLKQQESTLDGVGGALQRVRDLLLQGKSTLLSAADRRSIAVEVEQRFEEILGLANTRNEAGEYVFAGSAVDVRPFNDTGAGGVSYAGDQGVRRLQVGESRFVGDGFSGYDVFMAIRNGNGTFVTGTAAANTGAGRIPPGEVVDPGAYLQHDYRIVFTAPDTFDVIDDTAAATVISGQTYVPDAVIAFDGINVSVTGAPATGDEFTVEPAQNQSMFTTVQNIADGLRMVLSGAVSEAQFQQQLDQALADLDLALENVLEIRANIGARLNTLDAERNVNANLNLELETIRSELQDADITAVVSRLAQETNALEAAQAAFARVHSLTLFDFF
jgi:flagellar hook-associated protein 3 FlgL